MVKTTSYVILFVLSSFLFKGFCQSQDQNYIKTTEYLGPVILDSDFESSFDGWEEKGSVNYSLDNGRLKANVNSSWEGVAHPLNITTVAGETLKVKVYFDKGNTSSNVRIYFPEYTSSGTFVRWNQVTGNLQTGYTELTLTMLDSGNTIDKINIDKDNTNTSTQTYFYIDYVGLKRGSDSAIEKIENVTYLDGLGKAKQSIAIQQSPTSKDMVQHMEYDEFGRAVKQYLPLPSTQNTGNYITNAQSQILSYYQNNFSDQHPYSEVVYDNSPLNRTLESTSPGNTWQIIPNSDNDHTSKFEYDVNAFEEVLRFDIDEINSTHPLVQSYYDPGELLKNTAKNKNWVASDGKLNTKEVFTDKGGKKIAEFSYELRDGVQTKLLTYYVYDKGGNLRYVLTPKAFEAAGSVNYYEYFDWRPFLETPTYGGGGVSVTIANDVITIRFDAGFTPSKIKTQVPIVLIDIAPVLNVSSSSFDKYLDFKKDDGTIVYSGFRAEIINNYLYIMNNYGSGYLYQSFNTQTITATLNLSGSGNGYSFNSDILSDLCYQYKYDAFNRQIEQKVPGKDWEYMVYDPLDRPILTQDANLREQDKWLFVKYDAFGRVVYTGTYTDSGTRKYIQTQVDGYTNAANKSNIETRVSTAASIGGVSINYSNNAYPRNNIEVLTVSYYDDYNFTDSSLPTIPTTILGQTVTTRTKGLLTSSWTKTLDQSSWSKNYSFYDDKGRLIYLYDKNYLGGYTKNESQLDFRGKVEESITKHKRTNLDPELAITDYFEYDHVERPKKHYQNINSQAQELISENTYNELGQLVSKKVGGGINNANPLQTVDYTYNIRGWLTKVNDVNNLGLDLFAYNLKYNESIEGTALSDAQYNGNIRQVIWKSAYDNTKRGYVYKYDKLNRFDGAYYREGSSLTSGAGKFETTNISYDANGNILALKRKDHSGQWMDDLTYNYDSGNKLFSIDDATNNNTGFNDGSSSSSEYDYDLNGNLIKDLNKTITAIEYNHLDLVKKVTFNNGNRIEFTYDANGSKLQMKTIVSGGATTSIDYLGGFQYTGGQLQFFPTPEGYVSKNGSTYKYVYIYRDHLGNNRLSYSDIDNSGIISSSEIQSNTSYYAMGMIHNGEYVANSNYNYKYQDKEQLAFNGYNMYDFGSRMYDASVGRWFNMDPQNQFWSPYIAMGNVWVIGGDNNGEFWHIVIGAFVGGVINTVANWDNINKGGGSFWQKLGRGASYFGIGAASGAVTAATGNPIYGAAILSAGNSAYTQYDQVGSIDPAKLIGDTVIGTSTAAIGGQLSPLVSKFTSPLFANANSIASKYISDALANTVTGFSLSTVSGLAQGQSLNDSFDAAIDNIPQSLAISVIGTAGSQLNSKYYSNKQIKEQQLAAENEKLKTKTKELLQEMVNDAWDEVKNIDATIQVKGIKAHKIIENRIRDLPNRSELGLHPEESFKAQLDGRLRGGRIDVIDRNNNMMYDYKFGASGLRPYQVKLYKLYLPDYKLEMLKPNK